MFVSVYGVTYRVIAWDPLPSEVSWTLGALFNAGGLGLAVNPQFLLCGLSRGGPR